MSWGLLTTDIKWAVCSCDLVLLRTRFYLDFHLVNEETESHISQSAIDVILKAPSASSTS